MTTVVVTGATGNVGRHVVSELRRRGIPHRALARNPERATAVLGPGADLAQGDFTDPESLRSAFTGAEQAFLSCADDPRQVENAANAIEAAATAGVRQIVLLSTVGAEAGAETTFADQHGRIEHRLRSAGIPFVILRSSFLMSNPLGSLPTIGPRRRLRPRPHGTAPDPLMPQRAAAGAAEWIRHRASPPAGSAPGTDVAPPGRGHAVLDCAGSPYLSGPAISRITWLARSRRRLVLGAAVRGEFPVVGLVRAGEAVAEVVVDQRALLTRSGHPPGLPAPQGCCRARRGAPSCQAPRFRAVTPASARGVTE
ncbi:SDR family oxidoreductase [Streptomyces sp. NBC_01233]|uniref:SDR family oxidoreductase n=1 Tax=Streptomyces sp. NBC_01233 TaxID=2903787 RepID=UPI002E110FBC|nr:NAD(P)H-binding protein [Streptomyces sp. NBC_01233]